MKILTLTKILSVLALIISAYFMGYKRGVNRTIELAMPDIEKLTTIDLKHKTFMLSKSEISGELK